uniref:Ribosomal protein S14 n=1 Tax=Proteomonas sulcata TaxID=77928 RepID=A0A2P1G8B0_9CRYP|nr:ribosomal protein S14 [Proteomonas sulcata]AVM81198.1 ribosomal protein S14 [Proteomonas sulcata]
MKKKYLQDQKRRLLFKQTELKAINRRLNIRLKDLNILQTLIQQNQNISSLNKVKNRCCISGRSRSVYKKFRMSRIAFRELSLNGLVNGVKKASW